MNPIKYLEKRIRGWLPKELSLPRNQRNRVADYLMRLHFLRLAYGVMLGALLVMPFGVYHSRVEPYIIGFLWGYHLPIGYAGLLLGIAVALYPRLNKLRSLRFSSFVPLIGLFLLLSFFFSPKYYFINLIHGTNFSSSQIDVDSPVGNSVVMVLSLLSIVFGLVSFVRGWLPKEQNFPSNKVKMADAKTKAPKPRWWRPLWIATVVGTIVSGLVSFLIFSVHLERVIGLLFFAFACIGFAYYIRVRPSIKVNRAVYILLGISPIGFCLSLAWIFTIGRYITPWLGIWGFLIGLTVPCTIGAFIGDWIGKRRNYQLPLSP